MEQILAKVEKICGKENMEAFYTKMKETLAATPKENEKKLISFQLKGCQEEPSGIGFSFESIDKTTYPKFVTEEKDYMKDSITVVTATIGLKDAGQAGAVEQLFNQFKPMIEEIPQIKPLVEAKKVDYHLRITGTKANLDVILKDEIAQKKLQEIGIDFSEFQNFKFLFKTGLKGNEIFDMTLEQLAEKALGLIVSLEASTTNAHFLIKALKQTLEGMNITEEKQVKRLKKLKLVLGGVLSFVEAKAKFQFDAKNVVATAFDKSGKYAEKLQELGEGVESGKAMVAGFGGDTAKGMLEGFGVYEPAKAADIDEIVISVTSTQMKNGFAFTLNLPGVTEFVNSKFLSA